MEFWKMNGAGNDFIIINNMNCDIALTESDHILLKEHSMPGKSDKIH